MISEARDIVGRALGSEACFAEEFGGPLGFLLREAFPLGDLQVIGLLVCGPADTTIPDRAPDDQAARSRTRCTTPGSASPSPFKGESSRPTTPATATDGT